MDTVEPNTTFCKLQGHSKEVSNCAFSRDVFVTCSGDKSIRVYSARDFKEKTYSPLLAHKYGVNCVCFDTTGQLLASASTDGSAHLWRITENEAKVLSIFKHADSAAVQVCNFSPNSSMLVTGTGDGGIAVWSIEKKKKLHQIEGHSEGNVNAAAFTPCNKYLVTGSVTGDVRVWNLNYAKLYCILQTEAHDKSSSGCGVDCVCFSPMFHRIDDQNEANNYLMASCGQDNQIKMWAFKRDIAEAVSIRKDYNAKCLQPLHELSGHNGPVSRCCFSPDGLKLASSSFDKTVILWNPITGEQLLLFDGHSAIVTCVSFSVDGRYLASTSYDKTTIVWRLTGNEEHQESADNVANGLVELALTDQVKASKNVKDWTTNDVIEWLEKKLKLTQYSTSFLENEIDGDELVNLTAETLSKELGVAPLGHRNKILRGIKALNENQTPSSESSSTNIEVKKSPSFQRAIGVVPSAPTVTSVAHSDMNIPEEFLCPITREIMKDPVIAADGFTYERIEIEEWFRKGSKLSPMTNAKLPSTTLLSNQALKNVINQFMEGGKSNEN